MSFEKQGKEIQKEISCLRNELNSSLEKILGNFERNINRLEDKLKQNNDELKNMINEIAMNKKESPIVTQPLQESGPKLPKSYAQVVNGNIKETSTGHLTVQSRGKSFSNKTNYKLSLFLILKKKNPIQSWVLFALNVWLD